MVQVCSQGVEKANVMRDNKKVRAFGMIERYEPVAPEQKEGRLRDPLVCCGAYATGLCGTQQRRQPPLPHQGDLGGFGQHRLLHASDVLRLRVADGTIITGLSPGRS
jgi:hypothetical protein